MTRIILLRHGESVANAKRIGTGQTDVALTELGIKQARLAADYLLTHEKIDRVYSSDLQRTRNTARPTAEALGLDITEFSALREMDIGDWVGLTPEERKKIYPEESRIFTENFSLLRYPNGEYVPEVYDRVVDCVSRIARENEGKTVLIATHAGAIRVFHAFAVGLSRLETGLTVGCENASINIYGFEGGRAFPIETNITAHLRGETKKTAEEDKI